MIETIVDRCSFFDQRSMLHFPYLRRAFRIKTWIGQGVETRRINQRVKGYLLDVIVREALTGRLPRRALVPLRGCLFTSIRQDKGYKLPPIGFLSFLILHEAYQRGEICAALTESEQAWDDAVSYVHRDWSEQ